MPINTTTATATATAILTDGYIIKCHYTNNKIYLLFDKVWDQKLTTNTARYATRIRLLFFLWLFESHGNFICQIKNEWNRLANIKWEISPKYRCPISDVKLNSKIKNVLHVIWIEKTNRMIIQLFIQMLSNRYHMWTYSLWCICVWACVRLFYVRWQCVCVHNMSLKLHQVFQL